MENREKLIELATAVIDAKLKLAKHRDERAQQTASYSYQVKASSYRRSQHILALTKEYKLLNKRDKAESDLKYAY